MSAPTTKKATKDANKGKPKGKITDFLVDENPYAPLISTPEIATNDKTKKRSPTWGRGRGRKRQITEKPGPSTRQPPTKGVNPNGRPGKSNTVPTNQNQCDTIERKEEVSVLESNDSHNATSSWFDEDDEDNEQSEINVCNPPEHIDEESTESESGDMVDEEDIGIAVNRIEINTKKNDKGRKRTSTKEAPVDFQQPPTGNGKSTAPQSKKQRLNNKSSRERSESYAEVLEDETPTLRM